MSTGSPSFINKISLRAPNLPHRAGLLSVIFVIGLYNSLFAFSFFPLTEGWFSAYAHQILEGKVLYRDLYLSLTPLYPMALSAIVWTFGESFFILRMIGVFIILAIFSLLYLILAKRFSPSSSMLAAITACLYYQSHITHIPYDFIHVVTLFVLASTWVLVQAGSEPSSAEILTWKQPIVRRMFLAGLFAALAFLTKQSNGATAVVAIATGCIYIAVPWGRNGWKLILAFSIGCFIPVFLTFLWLFQANALSAFWEQIFGGALAAKGSLDGALFGWITRLLTPDYWHHLINLSKVLALVIVASFILNKVLSSIDKSLPPIRGEFIRLVSLTLICILVIACAYFESSELLSTLNKQGERSYNSIIPVATSLSTLLLVLGITSTFVPTVRKLMSPVIVILGIVSAGMIWGSGTSGGLEPMGTFSALALALVILLDTKFFRYTATILALLLVMSFIFLFATVKFNNPYGWWGVSEQSVHRATYLTKLPLARGLWMSQSTSETTDALTDALTQGPQEGDIFAFPHISQIYLIAKRWPDSKIIVPWFDMLPDTAAQAEARRLQTTPPGTIVNLKLPETVWEIHERVFRKGHAMGQRAIQNVIDELTLKRKLYKLALSREIMPGSTLEVWQKLPHGISLDNNPITISCRKYEAHC
jgi:hypothetical protein